MISNLLYDSCDGRPARFASVLVVLMVVGILMIGSSAGVVAGANDITRRFQHGTLQTNQESNQICGQNVGPLITLYNNHIEEVPWFFKLALQDQEIHTVIQNDTQENYTFVTGSNGSIQSFDAGIPASPGVRVITSCESFSAIRSADDPVSKFWSEYRNDRVEIVGIGFVNWLLIEILKHPVLAGGISILLFILAGVLVYYYVRRRRMVQGGFVYGDEGSE